MWSKRWIWTGLIVVAGFAVVLLTSRIKQVFGVDSGNLGSVLLVSVTWIAMWSLSGAPRSSIEVAVAPGEIQAWIGLSFVLAITLYFLSHAPLSSSGPLHLDPGSRAVGRNIVLMVIAWIVLGAVLRGRVREAVLEDERDRVIETRAAAWGRGALVLSVIGVAVMLGLSPTERLVWATPPAIANLLIFSLLWGALVENAVAAISYWWDRRP